ncbi:OsmC family protein [Defluviimonas sp. D31]|uniref:OsmC family protein n=1 Tax=Defluviimonas sp. D31 TaxID=3083253 RepID=UPI00296F91B1|nr:OsmC family protein [Defluviimonas sp. D31]MDW4550962.1 OsmC family protein [Defluviimonas sp. D31]
MTSITVELRNMAGTEAAMGWAGSHTLVADRPADTAGGRGLGFNGAQLLALAIGGCFCNDLRYVSHRLGIALDTIAVSVTLHLEGDPIMATSADMTVACTTRDGSDPAPIVDEARSSCMVSNSITRGVPVTISMAGQP